MALQRVWVNPASACGPVRVPGKNLGTIVIGNCAQKVSRPDPIALRIEMDLVRSNHYSGFTCPPRDPDAVSRILLMKKRTHPASLVAVFSVLLSSAGLNADEEQHRKECDEVLANFRFEDSYGGVDNALTGRWFIHFQDDGGIRLGFWGEAGKRPIYAFDDQREFSVDLGDVFKEGSEWKRDGDSTMLIKVGSMQYRFEIIPNYGAGDSSQSCQLLRFSEVGGKRRVFQIGFYPEYREKFLASSEIR